MRLWSENQPGRLRSPGLFVCRKYLRHTKTQLAIGRGGAGLLLSSGVREFPAAASVPPLIGCGIVLMCNVRDKKSTAQETIADWECH